MQIRVHRLAGLCSVDVSLFTLGFLLPPLSIMTAWWGGVQQPTLGAAMNLTSLYQSGGNIELSMLANEGYIKACVKQNQKYIYISYLTRSKVNS